MTGTISLPFIRTLIAMCAYQFISFVIQEGVQDLLHTVFNEIPQFSFIAASFNCMMLSDMALHLLFGFDFVW